jgi:hypothetical protein
MSTVRDIASLLLFVVAELDSKLSLWLVFVDKLDLETIARSDDMLRLRDASSPAFQKNGFATGMHAHKQAALDSAAASIM